MRTWRTRIGVAAGLASAALVIGSVPAASGNDADAGVDVLLTKLDGAQEVPGPGDDDGRGVFAAIARGDTLCYVLTAVRIETAAAAHIHAAPAGEAGDVIITLETPNKVGKACITAVPDAEDTPVTMSESELAAILAEPSDYYVNVHNAAFPAGAIRGQLS